MVDLWGPGAFGAADAAPSRPPYTPTNGGGDPDTFYQDCTSPSNDDGTEWRSAALNAILAQLRASVRKSGIADTNLDDALLARAIRSQKLNFFLAGGTANALTVTMDPQPASWADVLGMPLHVVAGFENTGPATIAIAGLAGTRPITRAGGTPLQRGDILFGQVLEMFFDGTQVQISGLNPALLPTRGTQVYATPGTFTWTPGPGTFFANVRIWAGGGGGGGSTTTSGAAAGGAGGEYREGRVAVTPGVGITVVVGAGGAAGPPPGGANPNGVGGSGGNSSFGGVIVAAGGGGGFGTVSGVATTGGSPGAGSGAGTTMVIGAAGGSSGFSTGSGYVGGQGGTAYGSSPSNLNAFTAGQPGRFPAGGGSGSAANANGGGGAGGLVIIDF